MNLGKLTVVTPPLVEPVSLDEAKDYLRVDIADDDPILTRIITAAREFLSGWAGLTFIDTVYAERFNRFPIGSTTPIKLQRPPLTDVTEITYIDGDGATQTWDSAEFQFDIFARPGLVLPVEGFAYPVTAFRTFNAVTVAFTAGEGAAGSDVQAKHRQAILWLCEHMYEQRDIEITGATISQLALAWKNMMTEPVFTFG